MKTTRHAKTNYKMLAPFFRIVTKNGDFSQFRSGHECLMPLSIEDLHYVDYFGYEVYAISNTGVMNGDLMRDPEMLIAVNHHEMTIRPLTFRNDYMGVYQQVFDSERVYRPRLLTELDEFLWIWLKENITRIYDPGKGIKLEDVESWEA